MITTRRSVIAAVAVLALGGTMVASAAPADAHTYASEGTVSAKEANKLFKQAFKQKCLTVHEAQHIVHGSGELESYDSGDDGVTTYLTFTGTKKSHIRWVQLTFEEDDSVCADSVEAYKR